MALQLTPFLEREAAIFAYASCGGRYSGDERRARAETATANLDQGRRTVGEFKAIVTILVPFLLSVVFPLWLPDCLVVRLFLYAAAALVLFVLAELAVAFALERDRSKAKRFVSQEVTVVWREVRTLREQHADLIEGHGDSIEDLRRQIDDLDAIIRSAFEELVVALPPREVVLHAQTIGSNVTMPAPTVRSTGGASGGALFGCFNATGVC